jgi:RHS repeat-associated protein
VLDERLWVQQDANYNVTALVSNSGSVAERDVYDPYGAITFLNSSWGTLGGSAYAWIYLFQDGRLDPTSGTIDFGYRGLKPTLARWLELDPAGITGTDSNLYSVLNDSPIFATDPLGLWKITRVTSKEKADAVSDKETDTIKSLADIIGLRASEFRKWLTLSKNGLTLADGTQVNDVGQLNPDCKIKLGQSVMIPNTVFALWLGNFGAKGKYIVSWKWNLWYLRKLGFHIHSLEFDSDLTRKQAEQIVETFNVLSKEKVLHGFVVMGHGAFPLTNPPAFGTEHGWAVSYQSVGEVLAYKLALVILDVCYGTSGQKYISAAKDPPSAIFRGSSLPSLPFFNWWNAWDAIKPGEQGTNSGPGMSNRPPWTWIPKPMLE